MRAVYWEDCLEASFRTERVLWPSADISPSERPPFGRATDLNGFSPAFRSYMYEDLSEIYQAALEDERKRKYMKEIGDWLVEEYFEPYQAS